MTTDQQGVAGRDAGAAAAAREAALEAALTRLREEAEVLRPPAPHERASVLRNEAGLLLDRLLVAVARGRGALDVAIGEGLAALAVGDRALQLGYSGIGDYARERLGLAPRTAQAMARLARELRLRPALSEAVRRGEVSARMAQAVLPVARGDDEVPWVARARSETVRAIEAAVRAARGGEGASGTAATAASGGPAPAGDEDEPWERLWVPLTPEGRARLDEAMALAGKLLGGTAPRWQRLEAICQEYLSSHPPSPGVEEGCGLLHGHVPQWLEQAKEALEQESSRWCFLHPASSVEALPGPGEEREPPRLDAELRRLAAMRDRWDDVLGHLAMLFRMLGLWRDAKFASFAHYCEERLGMGARTVAQRASLARRLYELPALRQALREGRVSYEQARLVARCADDASAERWIARAEATTCIALRRELEAAEEEQMCARGELALRAPARVTLLVETVFRAAREAEGRWLTLSEAMAVVAKHFVETWREALKERKTPHRRVLERDGGYCQVPGCSRPATHAHHVRYRSRGGSDHPANLVGMCAAHHLHGIHRGFLRVRGEAPDRLAWELGVA